MEHITAVKRIFMTICLAVLLWGLSSCSGVEEPRYVDGRVQAPVSDEILYVSPSGDDDADGLSPETALSSIGQAMSAAGPGTTILVAPGTYGEYIMIDGAGSTEAPITIRGDGEGVILDGGRTLAMGIWCENCTNFIFENLEVKDYTDIGIGILNSSLVIFRDLTVHDNGFSVQLKDWEIEGYGIQVDDSNQVIVNGNQVYRNGPDPQKPGFLMGTGINMYGCSDCQITNNHSYENIGGGILVEDSFNVLVQGNEVRDNDVDASTEEWWDAGIWIDGGNTITLRDNKVQGNLGPGIEISDEDIQNPYAYVLENNVVSGNYFGLYVWNFGSDEFPDENILLLKDNQIHSNIRQDIWIEAWGCPPEDQPCD